MSAVYKIKELEWQTYEMGGDAETPFGRFYITKSGNRYHWEADIGVDWKDGNLTGGTKATWEDAQARCQEIWEGHLKKCLETAPLVLEVE